MNLKELSQILGLSQTTVSRALNGFPEVSEATRKRVKQIAEENNWIQESGEDFITEIIEKALAKFPDKVTEYKNGKKGLIGLFMGEVMKLSQGKADPKIANNRLREFLEK